MIRGQYRPQAIPDITQLMVPCAEIFEYQGSGCLSRGITNDGWNNAISFHVPQPHCGLGFNKEAFTWPLKAGSFLNLDWVS
jgi:hypothetical protein